METDFLCTQAICDDLDETYVDDAGSDSDNECGRKEVGSLKVLPNKKSGIPTIEFPIYVGENVVGRHTTCDISIPWSLALSKKHALLEAEENHLFITDCGSSNKTRLGKVKLKPNVKYGLRDNDELVFGDVKCTVHQKTSDSRPAGKSEDTNSSDMPSTATPKGHARILASDTPDHMMSVTAIVHNTHDESTSTIPESQPVALNTPSSFKHKKHGASGTSLVTSPPSFQLDETIDEAEDFGTLVQGVKILDGNNNSPMDVSHVTATDSDADTDYHLDSDTDIEDNVAGPRRNKGGAVENVYDADTIELASASSSLAIVETENNNPEASDEEEDEEDYEMSMIANLCSEQTQQFASSSAETFLPSSLQKSSPESKIMSDPGESSDVDEAILSVDLESVLPQNKDKSKDSFTKKRENIRAIIEDKPGCSGISLKSQDDQEEEEDGFSSLEQDSFGDLCTQGFVLPRKMKAIEDTLGMLETQAFSPNKEEEEYVDDSMIFYIPTQGFPGCLQSSEEVSAMEKQSPVIPLEENMPDVGDSVIRDEIMAESLADDDKLKETHPSESEVTLDPPGDILPLSSGSIYLTDTGGLESSAEVLAMGQQSPVIPQEENMPDVGDSVIRDGIEAESLADDKKLKDPSESKKGILDPCDDILPLSSGSDYITAEENMPDIGDSVIRDEMDAESFADDKKSKDTQPSETEVILDPCGDILPLSSGSIYHTVEENTGFSENPLFTDAGETSAEDTEPFEAAVILQNGHDPPDSEDSTTATLQRSRDVTVDVSAFPNIDSSVSSNISPESQLREESLSSVSLEESHLDLRLEVSHQDELSDDESTQVYSLERNLEDSASTENPASSENHNSDIPPLEDVGSTENPAARSKNHNSDIPCLEDAGSAENPARSENHNSNIPCLKDEVAVLTESKDVQESDDPVENPQDDDEEATQEYVINMDVPSSSSSEKTVHDNHQAACEEKEESDGQLEAETSKVSMTKLHNDEMLKDAEEGRSDVDHGLEEKENDSTSAPVLDEIFSEKNIDEDDVSKILEINKDEINEKESSFSLNPIESLNAMEKQNTESLESSHPRVLSREDESASIEVSTSSSTDVPVTSSKEKQEGPAHTDANLNPSKGISSDSPGLEEDHPSDLDKIRDPEILDNGQMPATQVYILKTLNVRNEEAAPLIHVESQTRVSPDERENPRDCSREQGNIPVDPDIIPTQAYIKIHPKKSKIKKSLRSSKPISPKMQQEEDALRNDQVETQIYVLKTLPAQRPTSLRSCDSQEETQSYVFRSSLQGISVESLENPQHPKGISTTAESKGRKKIPPRDSKSEGNIAVPQEACTLHPRPRSSRRSSRKDYASIARGTPSPSRSDSQPSAKTKTTEETKSSSKESGKKSKRISARKVDDTIASSSSNQGNESEDPKDVTTASSRRSKRNLKTTKPGYLEILGLEDKDPGKRIKRSSRSSVLQESSLLSTVDCISTSENQERNAQDSVTKISGTRRASRKSKVGESSSMVADVPSSCGPDDKTPSTKRIPKILTTEDSLREDHNVTKIITKRTTRSRKTGENDHSSGGESDLAENSSKKKLAITILRVQTIESLAQKTETDTDGEDGNRNHTRQRDDLPQGASTSRRKRRNPSASSASSSSTREPSTPAKKAKSDEADSEEQTSVIRALRPKKEKPKVMFTGVLDTAAEAIVMNLGGKLATDIRDCTHLVTDKMRRTIKFLCAVTRGLHIVTLKWLHHSAQNGRFLSEDDFELTEGPQNKYVESIQEKYNFQLRRTLQLARDDANPLFHGLEIFTTKNVAPRREQLNQILECAGAKILTKMPGEEEQSQNKVVIATPSDKRACVNAVKAGCKVVNNEFALTGILRHQVDFMSHELFDSCSASGTNVRPGPSCCPTATQKQSQETPSFSVNTKRQSKRLRK